MAKLVNRKAGFNGETRETGDTRPYRSRSEQEGHSSWNLQELENHQRKKKVEAITGTENPANRRMEGRADAMEIVEEDEFGGKGMDEVMADLSD